MITKSDSNGKKTQVQMISLDQLVPQDHLLRKIDRYVDFDFIYDLVEEKYSAKTGRPGIDPVVLINSNHPVYVWNQKYEADHKRNRSQCGLPLVPWIGLL